LTISLNEQNDSGQQGFATLTIRDDNLEVVLSLSEGTMTSSAVHIYSGQCGPDLGDVVHPLTNLTNGMSVTLLEGVSLDTLRSGSYAINSHNAEDASVYTACGNISSGEPTDSATAPVSSDIVNFTLEGLNIPVGTTVTWTNRDGVSHTSTSGAPGTPTNVWDSPTLGNSDSFAFTFNQAGEFPYFCRIHPSITATVTVTGP
jgi:plastocyanin